MSPFINTAWPRFFTLALPIAAFALWLNASADPSPHEWLIRLARLLAPFSLLVFLGLGWQRVRKAHAQYPILKSEPQRVLVALIGNVKLAALWFGLTLFAVFALLLAWVLLQRAAG
ncbi:hypothetical protein [uncultured Stenotrophomonas sp.]|uniref:hypothetical protein n=1 Tax=uncultured Stenotrophomonas sp. TaxID=165438 RepID=UPI0025D55952|nr:hypothetical protein [uncultured Stenotrophomonas sp.]